MSEVIIIAEAGVNHNGELKKAIELVEIAADAGADYVKFQTFKTDLNISKSAKKADYQEKNTGNTESQFEMVKKLELSFDDFLVIEKKCQELNIGFMSTGFDIPSIEFLDTLKPKYYKIPSGEITNKPYLEYVGKVAEKIILSTGMANIEEIKEAVNILEKSGVKKKNTTILHCNTEYPTPYEDVNLLAMLHIKNEIGVEIGYSDHTLGIEVSIAAVALGATIIEKHFTLNRNLPGPDHIASLEHEELKAMISGIRNIELAISGNGIKEASESEKPNKLIARKSIHIKRKLKKGHVLVSEDLIMRRPGDGISPMEIDNVLGKILLTDTEEDTKLSWELIN
jgi:N-acetylneuraminate synthase/N,N'-diacetyllegionaminate synthase